VAVHCVSAFAHPAHWLFGGTLGEERLSPWSLPLDKMQDGRGPVLQCKMQVSWVEIPQLYLIWTMLYFPHASPEKPGRQKLVEYMAGWYLLP